jgi:hypothetical protein
MPLRVLLPLLLLSAGVFLVATENLTLFFRIPAATPHVHSPNMTTLSLDDFPQPSPHPWQLGDPQTYAYDSLFCTGAGRPYTHNPPSISRLLQVGPAPIRLLTTIVNPYDEERNILHCSRTYTQGESARLAFDVAEGYTFNWAVNDIPCMSVHKLHSPDGRHSADHYEMGHPLGFMNDTQAWMFTHVTLTLTYHLFHDHGHAILLAPMSRTQRPDNPQTWLTVTDAYVTPSNPVLLTGDKQTITWTLDLDWLPTDVALASRWDAHLNVASGYLFAHAQVRARIFDTTLRAEVPCTTHL